MRYELYLVSLSLVSLSLFSLPLSLYKEREGTEREGNEMTQIKERDYLVSLSLFSLSSSSHSISLLLSPRKQRIQVRAEEIQCECVSLRDDGALYDVNCST